MTALAPALQAYFTDRLIGQRAASPNTIGAYKLTFRLLLTSFPWVISFFRSGSGSTPHMMPSRGAPKNSWRFCTHCQALCLSGP